MAAASRRLVAGLRVILEIYPREIDAILGVVARPKGDRIEVVVRDRWSAIRYLVDLSPPGNIVEESNVPLPARLGDDETVLADTDIHAAADAAQNPS